MKKYYSCILSADGCYSTYKTIYKKDPSARVYIINTGDDYERSIFFDRLTKNLNGYRLCTFNPFYDEAIDGIYAENLNTYVLSQGEYATVTPLLSGIWEIPFPAGDEKHYPHDLTGEIISQKNKERSCYKDAVGLLRKASFIKSNIHKELSAFIDEDKLVRFIQKSCKSIKNQDIKHFGKIGFLSSITPLGIHTHYDTLFHLCDRVTEICDEMGFVGYIILRIISDYVKNEGIPHIISPAYFKKDFPEILILPTLKTGICITCKGHRLPFKANQVIDASCFLNNISTVAYGKAAALLSAESRLIDRAVLSIYEGREIRFGYNYLTKGYSDREKATEYADLLTEKLITY